MTTVTGSEYIAAFLARMGCTQVYTLTGGACAFMVDAVARHDALELVCFQNEQAAAMAADAVWRVSRRVGVTMATSGPGATNLITGIACSDFDSIPTLHITGQVNQREAQALHGAAVRQTGFQETKIVEMVRPITKYAAKVTSVEELREVLGWPRNCRRADGAGSGRCADGCATGSAVLRHCRYSPVTGVSRG
ncbi:MAG: thiamine pyrophosphate-binding protein [Paracoccaceae bacterium]